MTRMKRIKTTYRGVYYIMGHSSLGKPERVYYIRYRRDGREFEEKVGRQFQDSMTAEKAARIRVECMEGKRLPRRELKEQKKGESAKRLRCQRLPRESEATFQSFVETASDFMCIADRDGYFTYMNKSMARTFGYSKEEMIGMHIIDLLPKDTLRKGVKQNFDELRNKGELKLERTWITRDGKEMIGDVRAVAFYDSEGRFMGSRGVFRDTTERKKAEKALRKRDDELDLKNKALEDLNAALHVLLKKREDDKTELEKKVVLNIRSLIMPYLDALKNSRLDLRQKSLIDIMESNLNDIISPLLHILSSMHLRLTPTEIKVCNLIKQGKTTKAIADLLSVSPKTIETHRKKIREKIGIKNKKENLSTHLMELHAG